MSILPRKAMSFDMETLQVQKKFCSVKRCMLRVFVTKYMELRQGSKFSAKMRAVFSKDLLKDAIWHNLVVKERLFQDAPVSQETRKKDLYDAPKTGIHVPRGSLRIFNALDSLG